MQYFIFTSVFFIFVFLHYSVKTNKVNAYIYYWFVLIVALAVGLRGNEDEYTRVFALIPPLSDFFSDPYGISSEKGFIFYFISSFFKELSLNSQSFQKYYLRNLILTYKQLDELGKFAFFPLHFEPEVSMQVVGRPYQNQIELIRNLALNLPAGMRVVVKEHPRSKGFRSLNYYKKLLSIPNVVMVNAELSTNLVSKKSALVAVISGSSGLEAAIIGRPVITFGKPVYNVLPDSMVKHIENLNILAYEIKELLEIYSRDISALERYIASIIAGSAPIDLYTVLLNKPNRFNAGSSLKKDDREMQEYNSLADYFDYRINKTIDGHE